MTIAFDDSDLAATRKANDGLARMLRCGCKSPIIAT